MQPTEPPALGLGECCKQLLFIVRPSMASVEGCSSSRAVSFERVPTVSSWQKSGGIKNPSIVGERGRLLLVKSSIPRACSRCIKLAETGEAL